MGKLLYARPSDNVAPLATAVTASAGDAGYPAANLVDQDPAKPAKLTTTSGNWVFNLPVGSRRVDVVALIHHNLTAGLEVRIQGNTTDSWSSPSFNQLITIPAYHEDGFSVCPFLDLTGLSGYTTGGFQFWRVAVIGTNAANVAIGEVVLASLKRQLEVNLHWGAEDHDEHPTIEHRTSHGVVRTYDLGCKVRRLKGEVETSDAGLASLRSLHRDARGRVKPFVMVPDPDVNDAWFVRFDDTRFGRSMVFVDRSHVLVGFEELSRGLPL